MDKLFIFKKERTFDAIIENSFYFFSKHIKQIVRMFWRNNMILIVGVSISYFLYYFFYFGMFNDIAAVRDNIGTIRMETYTTKFGLVALALVFFSIWFYPKFMGFIMGYMRVYMENDGKVDEAKVEAYAKRKFWGIIGLTLLLGIIFAIVFGLIIFLLVAIGNVGAVLLGFIIILPLIFYVSVLLSLVYQAYFFDDLEVAEAISETIRFMKNKFWFSFLVLFVMGLLVGLIGAIFNLPVMAYTYIKGLLMATNNDIATYSGTGDVIVAGFSVIAVIAQYILKILVLISSSLLYFHLKEYHTHEGTLQRIDDIGKDKS